jgi:hypothetical protein
MEIKKIPFIVWFIIISQLIFCVLLSIIVSRLDLLHHKQLIQQDMPQERFYNPMNIIKHRQMQPQPQPQPQQNEYISNITVPTAEVMNTINPKRDYYKELLTLNNNDMKSCVFYPDSESSYKSCQIPIDLHLLTYNIQRIHLAMMMCTRLVDIHTGRNGVQIYRLYVYIYIGHI